MKSKYNHYFERMKSVCEEAVRLREEERSRKSTVLDALKEFVLALGTTDEVLLTNRRGDSPDSPYWDLTLKNSRPMLIICVEASRSTENEIQWKILVGSSAEDQDVFHGKFSSSDPTQNPIAFKEVYEGVVIKIGLSLAATQLGL